MDSIEEIFSNEAYAPFLAYCKKNRYRKMTDLLRCNFDELEKNAGISKTLVGRITIVYRSYKKNHPDHFINVKPPRKSAKKAEPNVSEETLVDVKAFMFENKDRTLHIAEIAKAVGVTKKAQLQGLMEKADWCQAIDGSSYIYVAI